MIRRALIPLLFFTFSLAVCAQDAELLTIKPVLNEVSSRFKLRSRDIRSVSRVVERENFDVLSIYARFGGKQIEYGCDLWTDVEQRRRAFDARIGRRLNVRQRAAVRAARLELERRVLDYLVDEYFLLLDDMLEFNAVQREAFMHLLYVDSRHRHSAIVQLIAKPSELRLRLEDCDEDMERSIDLVLTPAQRRVYKILSFSKESVG
jgi:hypothetical protein